MEAENVPACTGCNRLHQSSNSLGHQALVTSAPSGGGNNERCTKVLVGIVVVFLVCHLVRLVLQVKSLKFSLSFQDKIKEKCSFPIPIHLIVVIVGTGLSHALQFEKKFGVAVVGQIPKG